MATKKTIKSPIKRKLSLEKKEDYTYDPSKQVEGLKKRFEGAGLDAEQVADTRGPIKKALNLKADQNVLFDFFELMKRPQQSLFGGIHATQEGDDFLEGMLSGIKGDKQTKFKNILHEEGFEDSEGRIGMDDVLGMAGDIFLDPMKLNVIPGAWAGSSKEVAEALKQTQEVQAIVSESQTAIDTAKVTLETAQAAADATGMTLENANKALTIAKQLQADKTLDAVTLAKDKFGDEYATILANIKADTNLLDELSNVKEFGKIDEFESLVRGSKKASDAAMRKLKEAKNVSYSQSVQLAAAKEGLKSAEHTLKVTEVQAGKFVSASKFITKKMGSGIRGTFSIADSGLTKVLQWLDKPKEAKNLELGKTIVDEFGNSQIGTMEEMYKSIKDTMERTFNYVKRLPKGLHTKVARIKGGKAFAEHQSKKMYEQRYKELKELSHVIADAYKKAGFGEITPEQAELGILGIYENGSNLFSEDIGFGFDMSNKVVTDRDVVGSINVSLSGMNKNVKLNDMLLADRYLQDMGLTQENAQIMESYIKVLFPDWYNSNITNGTRELFRMYSDPNGVVKDAYRIWDKTMHEELREQFKALSDTSLVNITTDKATDLIRLQTLNDPEKFKEMMSKFNSMRSLEQKLGLSERDLTEIGEAITAGHTMAVNPQTARELGLNEAKKLVQNEAKRTEVYNDRIDALVKKFGGLNVSEPAYKEVSKQLADLVEERNKFLVDVTKAKKQLDDALQSHGEDINELFSKLESTYNENKAGLDEFKTAIGVIKDDKLFDGKTLKEFGSQAFNIGNHYSDKHIEFMRNLFDLEESKEMLASVHLLHHQAADFITQYIGEGLEIDDYYISHVVTKEWLDSQTGRLVNDSEKIFDAGVYKLAGNTAAFQSRRYQTSIHEANRLAESKLDWLRDAGVIKEEEYLKHKDLFDKGLKMFEEDLTTSFLDFVTKGTKAAQDAHIYKAVIEATLLPSKQLLSAAGENKTDFVRVTAYNVDSMRGFNSYEPSSFVDKARGLRGYLPKETRESFIKALESEMKSVDGKVWISKDLDRLIGRVVAEPPEKKQLLQAFDLFNRVFKKNKLLTPGFQFRNVVGSISTMWLGGMGVDDIMKGIGESRSFIAKAEELMKAYTDGKLEGEDLKMAMEWMEFQANGFSIAGNKIQDIPKDVLYPNRVAKEGSFQQYLDAKKAAEKAGEVFRNPTAREVSGAPLKMYNDLIQYNLNMNMQMDAVNRFTVWRYAKDNPMWMLENGYESPEHAVRTIMFDYTDLSGAEQDVLKRLVPFYTFTKKNIAYQIQNMAKNTNRYIALRDMNDSLWTGFIDDEEQMDRHKYENFWIPIPVQKDGKYRAIKASLPIGDLGEFLSNPLRRSVASMAPPVRAPFEMAMNKQAFSGMPISQYRGEKGYYIPEISKSAEYGLSQFGLDVPAMGVMDPIRTFANLGKEDGPQNFGDVLTQGFGRSLVGEGDMQKTAERRAYDQLDHLQNQLRYYRSRNVDIPTLAEINNRNKFASSNRILGRLRSYRKK